MQKQGAYILTLQVQRSIVLTIGALGQCRIPAGRYFYVGSASRGVDQRVARHRRLAESKTGKIHWHIDYLLTHPNVRLIQTQALHWSNECAVSLQIASTGSVSTPVLKFGSTDCKAGCQAHLYRAQGRTPVRIPLQEKSPDAGGAASFGSEGRS